MGNKRRKFAQPFRNSAGNTNVTVVLKSSKRKCGNQAGITSAFSRILLPVQSPNPTMNLYLMRHANAGVPRESAKLDTKRGLIAEGKEQCMLMGRLLGALKVQPDIIVSSPLKRALQTAQFVGNELGYEGKVEISPALDLSASYADFQKLINKYADRQDVFFVGHNPNLFQFLGRLITGNGGAGVRMRKASVARIDMDKHPPLLQWLIDPRMARWIYASVAKSSRPKTSRK